MKFKFDIMSEGEVIGGGTFDLPMKPSGSPFDDCARAEDCFYDDMSIVVTEEASKQ